MQAWQGIQDLSVGRVDLRPCSADVQVSHNVDSPDHEDTLLYATPLNGFSREEWREDHSWMLQNPSQVSQTSVLLLPCLAMCQIKQHC